MKTVFTGVAAIALAAAGAHAAPGQDKHQGGNHGNDNTPQAAAQRGGGAPGNSDHGQGHGNAKSPDNGNGQAARPQNAAQPEKPGRDDVRNSGGAAPAKAQKHAQAATPIERDSGRDDRGGPGNAQSNDKGKRMVRDMPQTDRSAPAAPALRQAQRPSVNDQGSGRFGGSREGHVVERIAYQQSREALDRDRGRSVIDGCPPGLAKKRNGCTPPGLARKADRTVLGYQSQPRLFGLSNYGTGRYYYDDGYLLRMGDGGGIAGYIPLLGGALASGNIWPSNYASYSVPDYYVDYYDLGAANSYRYADNVIYRVDPDDAAIMSVAALLTGNDIEIGQPMPAGYDVYNVPYAYRETYYDTPTAQYRYSDGYVYRIDPTTQLVAAAIDLLV